MTQLEKYQRLALAAAKAGHHLLADKLELRYVSQNITPAYQDGEPVPCGRAERLIRGLIPGEIATDINGRILTE